MRPELIDVNYAPQDGRIRIDIIGTPGDCIDKAKQVCDAMINPGNWVFVSIEGRRQSGATLPSDFAMKIVAERMLG